MRRLLFAVIAAVLTAPAVAVSAAPPLVVPMDQGTRIQVSGPIRDVVVANPRIADVNVLDARSIVVLGKAAGATSLLVVDPAGRVLMDRQVVVSSADGGRMSYVRGGQAVKDFNCSPQCDPTAADNSSPRP